MFDSRYGNTTTFILLELSITVGARAVHHIYLAVNGLTMHSDRARNMLDKLIADGNRKSSLSKWRRYIIQSYKIASETRFPLSWISNNKKPENANLLPTSFVIVYVLPPHSHHGDVTLTDRYLHSSESLDTIPPHVFHRVPLWTGWVILYKCPSEQWFQFCLDSICLILYVIIITALNVPSQI